MAAIAATAVLAGCGDEHGGTGTTGLACDPDTGDLPDLPDGELFSLGVASGDPLHDRVILWTRLKAASEPLPDTDVPVQWEVAEDEAFAQVVACGTEIAEARYAHAVHADATGLQPQRTYWYRFHVGERTSPVGRTRTWPAADASPEQVTFAFAACQRWEEGYYTAYPHLVAEDGVEFVIWLGDYIYETSQGGVRPTTFGEATTLAEYRLLYDMYRSDPNLRAAHAAFPWIITWDDHEFVDDYVGDGAEDDFARNDPVLMASQRQRRFEAYQAWWENQPVRLPPPDGPDYRIYRTFAYGQLLQLQVLDTRQYRSRLECYYDFVGRRCPGSPAEDTKMLGDEQESWLFDELRRSPAIWNVLAQGVVMSETPIIVGEQRLYNFDQWDGFAADRQRLLQFLHDEAIPNPIVISGDIHIGGVSDLKLDFADESSPTVASELVCSSLASDFPARFIPVVEDSASQTPHVKYTNARQRGYVVCTVTPQQCTATFRVVDTVAEPESAIQTDAVFRIAAGMPGATEI